jgi:DNA-binding beta-propeller fold protein YncE
MHRFFPPRCRANASMEAKKIHMKKTALVVVFLSMGVLHASAQPAPPLALERSIPLPGVTGKFDHFAIDLAGHRLFAAATGNHSVEVVDLATGKVAQSITGLGKPHGLVWEAATESLYVADGSLAELRVYKGAAGSRLEPAGKLKLSDDADDMAYNESGHLLFVGTGGSDAANPARVAVVDTNNFKLTASLPVATHPEALEADAAGQRIFANIAESNEVAVMDAGGKGVVAKWKLENVADNVPMAFDAEHHALYVACRNPAMLLVLDSDSGKERSRIAIGGGADDLFYDAALHRVYVIGGAGQVDVVQADPQQALRSLGVVPTASGAKTALFVPAQSLLYLGVPGANGQPAEIRVYAPERGPVRARGGK